MDGSRCALLFWEIVRARSPQKFHLPLSNNSVQGDLSSRCWACPALPPLVDDASIGRRFIHASQLLHEPSAESIWIQTKVAHENVIVLALFVSLPYPMINRRKMKLT